MTNQPANVLVIKMSALGDVILAMGAFEAIRRRHPQARIALLTTAPYAELCRQSGWFDEVMVDAKPRMRNVLVWQRQLRALFAGRFDRVYDLQHKTRSAIIHTVLRLGGRHVEWSGVARGCSHPDLNPDRERVHTLERQAEQLRQAGIPETPEPTLDFLTGDSSRFELSDAFALLVPGSAPHRLDKRWPADRYGELATVLVEHGVTPVLIGGLADRPAIHTIRGVCPDAIDLSGETAFGDIAALGRRALFAVGNDTGPMHILAVAGCSVLCLFSAASDPEMTRPRGASVSILRRPLLSDLSVREALDAQPVRSALASRRAAE